MKVQRGNRRGFTVVEVIVVLVILSIIAAITIPSITGYIKKSNQKARTEVARSLFMASQNALTSAYGKGQADSITPVGAVNINKITPALPATELENNGVNIRYLQINQNMAKPEETAAFKLLDPYVSDKSILQDSIIVEYNEITGKVLSVFYSEEASTLGYTDKLAYNIYKRDKNTLIEKKTGYWGVESTGTGNSGAQGLEALTATLVDYTGEKATQGHEINHGKNYGLLTAEFNLPSKVPGAYDYELKFIPKTGGQTTIKIGPNEGINYGDLSTNLKDALVDSNPLTRGIYLDRDKNGAPLLVVVLDTTYSSYSISERYPNIAMGSFTASITGSLAGGKPATVASNVAHSYFESEATKDGITTYEIKSLRHLNNVRYANKKEAAGKVGYVQSGDVFGRDCFGDPLQFKPIGGNEGFTGKYVGIQDKKAHTIYDLTIAGGEGEDYVGLFGQVNEGAVVEGITMSYTDSYRQQAKTDTDPENQKKYFINGQKMTGMICGSNKGIIRNCSVSGKVNLRSSVAGVFAVGGIAGTNGWDGLSDAAPSGIGRIEGCYSAASVYADTSQAELSLVGGIAGGSKGIIAYCEVGTALGENKANEQMNLIGLPYSGANGTRDSGGKASYRYPAECKNDQVVITAGDKPAAVGGIVGGLSRFAEKDNKNPSNIMYCINGATVVATGETGEVSCGGLVGKTAGTEAVRLLCSVNAGKVVGGPTAVNGSIGGAVGYLSKNGEVSGTYNTGKLSGYALAGIAGGESKGLIESCYNIGSLENNLREHCYGIAKSGEVYSCAYLLNGQTFAPDPGWGDILPCEKDRDLQGFNFGGGWFNKAQNGGTGPFAYIYPTIKENNGNQGEYKPNYSIGSDFHRTPWGQAE